MNIKINGKLHETSATNITALLTELGLPDRGVAVGVNNRMVPRTEWGTAPLTEGMSLVVIKAAAGG